MDIQAFVAAALRDGDWKNVFQKFDHTLPQIAPDQQAAFTDLYFGACLQRITDVAPTRLVWTLACKWHDHRKLPATGYRLTAEAEKITVPLLTLLQTKLDRCLERELPLPGSLPEPLVRSAVSLWQVAFFSSYSPLHQRAEQKAATLVTVSPVAEAASPAYYAWLLRMSMYHPFDADRFAVDPERLLAAAVPSYVKVILAMWLLNVPRYNATQFHREKVRQYLPALLRSTGKTPAWMDPFFHPLAEWIMVALFRLAYIHEDNSALSCLFGDFVASQMQRIMPLIAGPPDAQPAVPSKRKIRLGYISTRFVTNAVTFYMANRILHHDRNTFEIYLFTIGAQQDEMTELLAQNSDQRIHLSGDLDYLANAAKIRECQLDILLYADIGMDITTYLLAGLRLAPVQGALLGHASPTGLPTMDYFFSSEVEPTNATAHYREQLIRLPNVGSAQILPPGLKNKGTPSVSRQQLGIPDDAFVFISCANGMKHVPERDYLWTEILRRVPQAWILVKPFNPWDYDRQMEQRIRQAGQRAGAVDRILYLAGCEGHNDVFSLLALADVQLDTYPFNGWTTTIEAFCLALPTITQEGNAYRSRLGAGFLRAMGITAGIAATEAEYVEWAVTLASDPALCRWIKNRIKVTRMNLLFDNAALQMEYEKALIEMARRQGGAIPCV